jgi:hypothetical protein
MGPLALRILYDWKTLDKGIVHACDVHSLSLCNLRTNGGKVMEFRVMFLSLEIELFF